MPTTVYIRVDDYYITPLVMNVNTDRLQKKKNGILMFNRLWFPEITDPQTFYLKNKNIATGCGFHYVKKG